MKTLGTLRTALVATSALLAAVTVQGGQKTLSQADADGQPLVAPEAADFPSVAELFEILREVQRVGCWRVAAVYDAESGCPTWCVIERLSGGLTVPKHVDQYRVAGFVWLR